MNGAELLSPTSKTLPDGTVVAQDSRGSALMSRLRPGVLLYLCSGYYVTEMYPAMVAMAETEITAHGSLVMLVDGWDLKSVESGYRDAWTEWFKRHKHTFRMKLLIRSKLMEMTASLANLFTGVDVVKIHSTISAWERAAAADVPGFKRKDVASHRSS